MHRGTFSTHPTTPAFRPATLSAYNVLLNIYASQLPTPNLARVHRTYRRLLNAGHSPDAYTYNILIKAFVNVGKPDLASQVYDTMRLHHHHHDSRAIHLLLRGWIEQRAWHQVEHFVARLTTDRIQLDHRAFNLMLQGFLQLHGRTATIDHLLKSHGDWAYWKHLQQQRRPYALTSTDLWHLLGTVTGRTKQDLHHPAALPPPTGGGFAALFDDQAFNQVSCKLFIKAFTLANDRASASMIKAWMDASYPPNLEKKPLV
jgi:pentatricopeptide repeat protein